MLTPVELELLGWLPADRLWSAGHSCQGTRALSIEDGHAASATGLTTACAEHSPGQLPGLQPEHCLHQPLMMTQLLQLRWL